MKHQALKTLEKAERAAWNAKMRGATPPMHAQRIAKLEQAWRDAADACATYREAHGLIGLTWRQIEALR